MKIIDPSKLIQNIHNKFDKSDFMIAVTVFVLGIINNFYYLIGDGVAPDALHFTTSFYIAGEWEIKLGRFLIKYFNMLRFGFINKLIVILISLICIIISILLIKRIFNIKNKLLLFIVSCIICIAPQFTETYMFIYCADAYLFAFLISVISVYFLNKASNKKVYYLFTLLCIFIVCALYQAYLGVIIGLLIALLINKILIKEANLKELLKNALIYITIVLVGIILYYTGLKVLIKILGLSLASYKGADSIGIKTILNLPKTIISCYVDFFDFFFSNRIINNTYYHRNILYIAIGLSSLVGIIKIIFNSKKDKIKKILFTISLIVIFPIGINIMNIISSAPTINLVTGAGILITIIFPIIILNNSSDDNLSNINRWLIILCFIILIWTFLIENIFTYYVREQTYNNYKFVTNDIYNKATSLTEYSNDKKWMFNDTIRFIPKDIERTNGYITKDNVTWGNYEGTWQNKKFFEKYNGVVFEMVDKSKYDIIKETEEYKEMPIYPNSGSIKIIDDVIVVKISNNTY